MSTSGYAHLDPATGKVAASEIPSGSDGNAIFGDGSDGDVTLGLDTTLTRDMYYNNLTTGAFTLNTAGYRVFVKGTCTVSASGKIACNGNSGSGQTAGATLSATVLGNTSLNAAGGDGGTVAGSGLAGGAPSNSFGGNGGDGGDGGVGGVGGGGSIVPPIAGYGSIRTLPQAITGYMIGASSVIAAMGGAGGGGGGSDVTGTGGGGGSGGGIIVLACNTLVLTGSIEAVGGNGADASGDNSGGGGGGGGGLIIAVYNSKSGAGSFSVVGGTGGTKTGTGTDGSDGSSGTLIELVN